MQRVGKCSSIELFPGRIVHLNATPTTDHDPHVAFGIDCQAIRQPIPCDLKEYAPVGQRSGRQVEIVLPDNPLQGIGKVEPGVFLVPTQAIRNGDTGLPWYRSCRSASETIKRTGGIGFGHRARPKTPGGIHHAVIEARTWFPRFRVRQECQMGTVCIPALDTPGCGQ